MAVITRPAGGRLHSFNMTKMSDALNHSATKCLICLIRLMDSWLDLCCDWNVLFSSLWGSICPHTPSPPPLNRWPHPSWLPLHGADPAMDIIHSEIHSQPCYRLRWYAEHPRNASVCMPLGGANSRIPPLYRLFSLCPLGRRRWREVGGSRSGGPPTAITTTFVLTRRTYSTGATESAAMSVGMRDLCKVSRVSWRVFIHRLHYRIWMQNCI